MVKNLIGKYIDKKYYIQRTNNKIGTFEDFLYPSVNNTPAI